MKSVRPLVFVLVIYLFTGMSLLYSQTATGVPAGIYYQAVARGSNGAELANTEIDVKFSIIAGTPLGDVVYEELHPGVITSKYGVFSLVIGQGTVTGGTAAKLTDINWSTGNHFLKVSVKFESSFVDMGTMQFLAVPYALYAEKSLEPGPQGPQGEAGPKGDQGDPASDDQRLSFSGTTLSIDGGNSVELSSLLQSLTVTPATDGYYLGLTPGNSSVKLSTIEADGDPTNEIQDLSINGNKLKITKNTAATEIDLSPYLDNTDSQTLSWDAANRKLTVSGSNSTVDLSELKNDADADPANEIQDLKLDGNTLTITGKTNPTSVNLGAYLDNTDSQKLTYNEASKTLTIDNGNTVTLGSEIAFRVKNTATDAAAIATLPIMTYDAMDYNIGNCMNLSTGIFTAPVDGIYTFNVSYYADGSGDGRELAIYLNSALYEKLAVGISTTSTVPVKSVTMRLTAGNLVSLVVYTGLATQTGTGTFSGYKVN